MEVTLDIISFKNRLKRFQSEWKSGFTKSESSWYGVDAVVFLSGRQDEERPTPKTDQFHLWLFGYVFPETLVVALRNGQIFVLTGPKKVGVLKQLQQDNLFFMEKSSEDGNLAHVQTIFKAIKSLRDNDPSLTPSISLPRLGRLQGKNEEPLGIFAQQVDAGIANLLPNVFQEIEIGESIALLLCIHDEKALACSIKAATLAVRLTQDVLILRIEDVLDNETKESHVEIANCVEKALDDKKRQERWKAKYNMEPDFLDIVYVNVQSGGKCDLRPSAQPSSESLYVGPGTILVSLGSKYQDFTANVVRTLLFNTTKEKRTVYQFTMETLDFGISLLIPGTNFTTVYNKIRGFVEHKNPSLLPFLTRTVGHTLGVEYREPSLTLNGKSMTIIQAGMVFNLSVGFGNVPSKDDNGETTYSIWLADTIEVRPLGQQPKVLTAELDRRLKSVNYELSDETVNNQPTTNSSSHSNVETDKKTKTIDSTIMKQNNLNPINNKLGSNQNNDKKTSKEIKEESPKRKKDGINGQNLSVRPQIESKKIFPTNNNNNNINGFSGVSESVVLRDRLRSRSKASTSDESEKLIERQKILRQRKTEEIRERFKNGGGKNLSTNKRSIKKMTSLVAYRDAAEYPKDIKPNRIHLDIVNEAVLVPMPSSLHIPFHVSTIRNVFCQAEDKKFYTVRLQFQVPGTTGFGYKSDANPFPEISGPEGMYVKELIFRSSSSTLPQLCKSLKELQKRIKQREETGDLSQDLAVQQPIEFNRKGGKRVLLKSVMVKTGTNNRRTPGTLEAHTNGLRFSGGRNETIDINFTNIKFSIFQPCENELLVLIHFHLKNPILVNKKKTTDVQFYTEVGSQTDDLDQRRGRSTYDPDEIAEEQREREMRRRLNAEFKRFVESVEEVARNNGERLEFDVPYRELAFHGVPKNSNQTMLPTARCLVQLAEWPVFLLSLEDIEIVSFERVYHGLRQFDIVFVFKDYTKPVRQITTVPIKSLDTIKRWLNEMDIVWYESKGNLNWGEIFKTIREDVVGFVEDGGFDIFLGEEGTTLTGGGGGGRRHSDDSGSDSEDEDYRDESSESYHDEPSSNSDQEEDEDDGTDDESLADEEESSDHSEDTADSNEEEGLSWEELERQAIKDDRKRTRQREEDDDTQMTKKKKKNY